MQTATLGLTLTGLIDKPPSSHCGHSFVLALTFSRSTTFTLVVDNCGETLPCDCFLCLLLCARGVFLLCPFLSCYCLRPQFHSKQYSDKSTICSIESSLNKTFFEAGGGALLFSVGVGVVPPDFHWARRLSELCRLFKKVVP